MIQSTRGSRRSSTSQCENARTVPFFLAAGRMSRNDLLLCVIYKCVYNIIVSSYMFAMMCARRCMYGQCLPCSLKRYNASRPASRQNCEQTDVVDRGELYECGRERETLAKLD